MNQLNQRIKKLEAEIFGNEAFKATALKKFNEKNYHLLNSDESLLLKIHFPDSFRKMLKDVGGVTRKSV
jgi:hypothetical protein